MTDYAVTDPSTGETVATYPTITDSELAAAIDSADRAHEEWARQTTTEDRAKLIGRVAALHAERREELAKIIVREVGKPLEQSLGEVDFCAAIYQFYADNGPRFLADQPVDLLDGEGSAVIRQTSLGVLLGIMPWNFPYYQVARFNGGSFVTESADPTEFPRRRLRDLTRLAVRDLGMHYLTIGTGCVRLAALRAHPSEVIPIRRRLERALADEGPVWSRHYDESLLELASLSQSARLTQEQMRLQSEFSPLLALIDDRGAVRKRQFSALGTILDAVAEGEPGPAAEAFEEITHENVERLVELHEELQPAIGENS